MQSYQIIIAACIPLLFCGCASTKKSEPISRTVISEGKSPAIEPPGDPQVNQLIRRVEELEYENSELRMQLLKNILNH
jgi:hypothetical protein